MTPVTQAAPTLPMSGQTVTPHIPTRGLVSDQLACVSTGQPRHRACSLDLCPLFFPRSRPSLPARPLRSPWAQAQAFSCQPLPASLSPPHRTKPFASAHTTRCLQTYGQGVPYGENLQGPFPRSCLFTESGSASYSHTLSAGAPRWPCGSAGQQSEAPARPESRLGWLGPSLCLCPSVCLSLSPNTAMTAPIAHMVSCQDLTLFRTFRSCLEPAMLGGDPVGQAVKLILTGGHVSLAVASRGRM